MLQIITVYEGPLGYIIKYADTPDLFEAWDYTDEYQGAFTSDSRAIKALQKIRDSSDAYNNR